MLKAIFLVKVLAFCKFTSSHLDLMTKSLEYIAKPVTVDTGQENSILKALWI